MRWMAALISCVMLSHPVLAREIDPAERREVPFDASLPACTDPLVLDNDHGRFRDSLEPVLELALAHRRLRARRSDGPASLGA